ncbi:hypothetical protein RIF29_41851 [Crotalaria pallida]|uniref:Uncharacterized protein n=1 Tax=Crotalaria pallida TaxID=3830 RepID=A0AAN9HT44_CROPI
MLAQSASHSFVPTTLEDKGLLEWEGNDGPMQRGFSLVSNTRLSCQRVCAKPRRISLKRKRGSQPPTTMRTQHLRVGKLDRKEKWNVWTGRSRIESPWLVSGYSTQWCYENYIQPPEGLRETMKKISEAKALLSTDDDDENPTPSSWETRSEGEAERLDRPITY